MSNPINNVEREKIIKDAQYRKGLSIAFFNATNSAISLVAPRETSDREEVLKEVCRIRDFFLEEHKNYYAAVIANVGANYKVEESVAKLKAATTLDELQAAWRLLSEDERRDEEIKRVANLEKDKYKNENLQ